MVADTTYPEPQRWPAASAADHPWVLRQSVMAPDQFRPNP
jgi:hypothetical protein